MKSCESVDCFDGGAVAVVFELLSVSEDAQMMGSQNFQAPVESVFENGTKQKLRFEMEMEFGETILPILIELKASEKKLKMLKKSTMLIFEYACVSDRMTEVHYEEVGEVSKRLKMKGQKLLTIHQNLELTVKKRGLQLRKVGAKIEKGMRAQNYQMLQTKRTIAASAR